jgi:hypothetical protein
VTDSELLKLMLHHIDENYEEARGDREVHHQRLKIIEAEMVLRESRTTPYQTVIQVDQVIPIGVGQCGQGGDKRIVQSSFEVRKGDQLLVYREGK